MPAPKGNQNARKEYAGRVYGHLTVLSTRYTEGNGQKRPILLCRCVCGKEVERRYDSVFDYSSCGCQRKHAGNRNHRGSTKLGYEATEHPTMLDIAWAAGLWEGEGSVTGNWFTRSDGMRVRLIQATVTQKDPWVLERFRSLFGGNIRASHQKGEGIINGRVVKRDGIIYHWNATGPRARGFFMTIWKFLSPRRHAQILNGFSFRES